ncbi:MAG: nuclear transport factor 2 family protein [Proteobacteria bacterium]|nr:nuclear transport factor 2 family protein [Pseudomonadota bacterium]HQR03977.1 nuclear transport factor 2 family protein [Rhodocyclaceae bacterium]
MLSLQEISDRMEIEQLVVDYADAIDSRRFDILDQVFTPDAYIDYRAMGGVDGRYEEIKPWLKQALAKFPAYQHMVANQRIRLDGDTATGRVMCFNPMETVGPDGSRQVMFLGLWYCDRFVRTPQGWRMCERVEERGWGHNVPGWVNAG